MCICTKSIGVFYYTIANLHPALRSTHRCIQLIAVITHPLLKKYGFTEVLKPFIDDVRKLYKVHLLYLILGYFNMCNRMALLW